MAEQSGEIQQPWQESWMTLADAAEVHADRLPWWAWYSRRSWRRLAVRVRAEVAALSGRTEDKDD